MTKDGNIAGPKALEHIVDTVLYFEGEKHHAHRVVRAVKNRFGAVSEVGVFEMTGGGLERSPIRRSCFSPSVRRTHPAPRCCAALKGRVQCSLKSRRWSAPAPTEMRAAWPAVSIRIASRCCWLFSKSAPGLNLAADDVFVNVAGGIAVDEPAADLGIIAAVASSVRNRP